MTRHKYEYWDLPSSRDYNWLSSGGLRTFINYAVYVYFDVVGVTVLGFSENMLIKR